MSQPDAYEPTHRLRLDTAALTANYRWLAKRSGKARCGAAVKADAYGLGARGVVTRLQAAGCRDFFVATWAEAVALADCLSPQSSLRVLHGIRPDDLSLATGWPNIRPVLVSAAQVALWRNNGGGRPADVMIDTGMNRLGLSPNEANSGLLEGILIDTLHSHLASADEDSNQNGAQLRLFTHLTSTIPAAQYSLANSSGILLGDKYHFDLTRPGLGLYGGVARAGAEGHIRQVVFPESQIIQVRPISVGDRVGYNGTWQCSAPCHIAIINLGYADGILRAFSAGNGNAGIGGIKMPIIGRVSMDLIAIAIPETVRVAEGDFLTLDYDLPRVAANTGLSQYELLTNLGQRFSRYWI